MKYYISFFIYVLFITACSNDNSTEPNIKNLQYNIYYSLSQQVGWRPEHSGLYRFEYPGFDNIEKINNYSIIHTTRVSKNGILAYVIDSPKLTLNIRFADGNIQQLIIPEFNDKSSELILTPKPEISLDAGKLAYFIKVTPKNSHNEMDNEYYLVVLDISSMETTLYNVMDFILNIDPPITVKFAEPIGENLLVSNDGSELYFVLKFYDIINNQFLNNGFAVIQLKDNKLISYPDIQKNEIQLLAKIIDENKTIVKINDKYYDYNSEFKLNEMQIPMKSLFSYRQFNEKLDKVILWDEEGVSLYNTLNFDKIRTIISWNALKEFYPNVLEKPNQIISLSPDGEIISFGVNSKGDEQSYHLFIAKSNGSELKKVLPFTPINCPVISYGFEIE